LFELQILEKLIPICGFENADSRLWI